MDWPFRFDEPEWLLLGLLVIPVVWLGLRSLSGLGPWRQATAIALRALLVALLAAILARPHWVREQKGLTVMAVLDRSKSIPADRQAGALEYLGRAVEQRPEDDRLGVVVTGTNPLIQSLPDTQTRVEPPKFLIDAQRTELGGAAMLGSALFPEDTARRMLLVSDGNENLGSLRAAAQMLAANGIPLDVVPLQYRHRREVLVDRMVVPTQARPGQTIPLRITLRSQGPTSGRLTLYDNDTVLDLDPESAGVSMPVEIDSTLHVETLSVPITAAGVHRFRVTFTPDAGADDAVSANNEAEAVTVVSGEGRVLLADHEGGGAQLLEVLQAARMNVDYIGSNEVPGDPVQLMGYDALILVGAPADHFSLAQQDLLRAYVHDMGGGLIMVGGPETFGAGGWIGSPVAEALPVKLDPPQKKQMPKGALVLIMHSCEMPNGNYWGEQTALAAVRSLSSRDLVGVIDYGFNGGVNWEYDLAPAGDKKAVIAAIKNMAVGDMPDFNPALQMAYNGLSNCDASVRHVIIISDGDPQAPTPALLGKMRQAKITCTGVGIFPHSPADVQTLNMCAIATGGRFYNVTNPNTLPQIFIKEAQVVHRPLIVERDPFLPKVGSGLSPLMRGLDDVAALTGYILTDRRRGLVEMPLVTPEGDPLLAHWQYGLGRSVAFTSTADSRWAGDWLDWPGYAKLWEQTVRWAMRSSGSANFQVTTRREGTEAIVEVEAMDKDAGFLNFLSMRGTVLDPESEARQLRLRQVGPGLYQGKFLANERGSYVVNLNYSHGQGEEQASGLLLAAVSNAYSPEYRNMESNVPLLTEVARMTGGRVLPPDPAQADLFNRETLTFPTAEWDLTVPLTMFWLALFLVDVAARRVVIDWRAARNKVKTWLQRSAKAPADERLARLQERRKEVREKLAPKTRYVAPEEKTAPVGDLQEALGGPQSKPVVPEKPRSAKPDAAPKEKTPEPAVHTSRLLDIKRKAREDMKKPKREE